MKLAFARNSGANARHKKVNETDTHGNRPKVRSGKPQDAASQDDTSNDEDTSDGDVDSDDMRAEPCQAIHKSKVDLSFALHLSRCSITIRSACYVQLKQSVQCIAKAGLYQPRALRFYLFG